MSSKAPSRSERLAPVDGRFCKDRLNHDQLSELLADGEAGIADLADEIIAAGNETDHLILAEPDFAEAILNFRRSAKLLDAHGDTALNTVERTNLAMRAGR
jgi:hypothetical protein